MTVRSPASIFLASLFGATLGLSGGAPSSAAGAEWHTAPKASPAGAPVTTEARAAELAKRYLADPSLQLDAVDLVQTRVLTSGSLYTVRYVQSHMGLPVIGAQAAVRIGKGGVARVAVLNVERHLAVKIAPSISAVRAAATVQAATSPLLAGVTAAPTQPSLAVMPDGQGGLLVWQLHVATARGTVRVYVDAHADRVVGMRLMRSHASGRVYPISSVVTPTTQDLELLELTPSDPQTLNGWNGNFSVTNYVSGSSQSSYVVEQSLTPSLGADFLYDPPADATDGTDGFAQVGIYYHLTRMRAFFATELALDMSAPSWRLVAVANAQESGQPMDNAFFSPMGQGGAIAAPNLISIGQGSTFDFAQDSDVFNHEFTHYVMNNAVGYNAGQIHGDSYGLSPWSGSIDEGLSDYFASTVNGDAVLGEASLALVGASRDLTDTTKSCPDDVLGEVHEDGELIGSATWSLRTAFGATLADRLVWDAATLLTFGASFGDFASAIKQSATDMLTNGDLTQADVDKVDAILASRGLDTCGPELLLEDAVPQNGGTLLGLQFVAQALGTTCQQAQGFGVSLQSLFHFAITPAPGDTAVRVTIDLAPLGTGSLKWTILGRQGQHVGFSAGQLLPTASEFDHTSGAIQTEEGELVIDAASNPPFDPSKTYHFVVTHQNCPSAQVTVTAALSDASAEVDAGVDMQSDAGDASGTGEETGGCGCTTGLGTSGASAWLLGAFGLLAVLRPRRRRR